MDASELYGLVLLGVVALSGVVGIVYTQLPTGMLALDCVQVMEPTGIGRLHCGDEAALRSASLQRFPTRNEQGRLVTSETVNRGIYRPGSVIVASQGNRLFSGDDYLARKQGLLRNREDNP